MGHKPLCDERELSYQYTELRTILFNIKFTLLQMYTKMLHFIQLQAAICRVACNIIFKSHVLYLKQKIK